MATSKSNSSVRSHADRVRALVDLVQQEGQKRTVKVECPDQTKRLRAVYGEDEPPFEVEFRPMTLDEMIELGEFPPVLVDELDKFNTAVMVFQLEADPEDGESTEHFNKRSISSALRDQGAMSFMQRTKAVRDATISICSINPRILPSVLEIGDPDTEMAIEHFTTADRDVMHRAIQNATGETTTEELKSLLDADSPESGDASVEEVSGLEGDTSGGSAPSERSE